MTTMFNYSCPSSSLRTSLVSHRLSPAMQQPSALIKSWIVAAVAVAALTALSAQRNRNSRQHQRCWLTGHISVGVEDRTALRLPDDHPPSASASEPFVCLAPFVTRYRWLLRKQQRRRLHIKPHTTSSFSALLPPRICPRARGFSVA